MVIRSSLFSAALGFVFALMCAIICVAVVEAPFLRLLAGPRGESVIVRSVLGGIIFLFFAMACVMLIACACHDVYRFCVPHVLDFDSAVVRIRVSSRWGGRGDFTIPRADVRDIVLRANQFAASYDVSIALASGEAVCVAEAASPAAARSLKARLGELVRAAALPVARVVRR